MGLLSSSRDSVGAPTELGTKEKKIVTEPVRYFTTGHISFVHLDFVSLFGRIRNIPQSIMTLQHTTFS
jgi:hypothetical protein